MPQLRRFGRRKSRYRKRGIHQDYYRRCGQRIETHKPPLFRFELFGFGGAGVFGAGVLEGFPPGVHCLGRLDSFCLAYAQRCLS